MELEDLKIISELIHKYGVKELEKVAMIHSLFLDYMQNHDVDTHSKFYETETSQFFTDCKNSIYCFEPKIINFDLLKTNTNFPISIPAEENEILKYLDNAKEMLGDNPSPAHHLLKTGDYGTFIGFENYIYGTKAISLQDYKMINLLLKKTKIHVSTKEPIVHFEGENGYAYILGRIKYSDKSIF